MIRFLVASAILSMGFQASAAGDTKTQPPLDLGLSNSYAAVIEGQEVPYWVGKDLVNESQPVDVSATLEIADPENGGALTVFKVDIQSIGFSTSANSTFWAPAKLSVSVSKDMSGLGNEDTVIDLAQIAVQGAQFAEGDWSGELQLTQFQYKENNDAELAYDKQTILNMVSLVLSKLIKQGTLPHSDVPVSIFVRGGLALGSGAADLDGVEDRFVLTSKACAGAEMMFKSAAVVAELCGDWQEAHNDSGLQDTAEIQASLSAKLHNSPIEVFGSYDYKSFDDNDNENEKYSVNGGVRVRWY